MRLSHIQQAKAGITWQNLSAAEAQSNKKSLRPPATDLLRLSRLLDDLVSPISSNGISRHGSKVCWSALCLWIVSYMRASGWYAVSMAQDMALGYFGTIDVYHARTDRIA